MHTRSSLQQLAAQTQTPLSAESHDCVYTPKGRSTLKVFAFAPWLTVSGWKVI